MALRVQMSWLDLGGLIALTSAKIIFFQREIGTTKIDCIMRGCRGSELARERAEFMVNNVKTAPAQVEHCTCLLSSGFIWHIGLVIELAARKATGVLTACFAMQRTSVRCRQNWSTTI